MIVNYSLFHLHDFIFRNQSEQKSHKNEHCSKSVAHSITDHDDLQNTILHYDTITLPDDSVMLPHNH
jgi:hypothetical protein